MANLQDHMAEQDAITARHEQAASVQYSVKEYLSHLLDTIQQLHAVDGISAVNFATNELPCFETESEYQDYVTGLKQAMAAL